MGILFSILSALFFGLYTLPKKLSKLPPFMYTILMAVGFTVSSSLAYLMYLATGNPFDLNNANLLYSALAGVLWAIAFTLLVASIDRIGVVRSNQWKNLQGPIGVGLNLLFLGEAARVNPYLALIAGVLIFLSAVFFNNKSATQTKANDKGVWLAIASGVLFGLVSLINNFVTKTAGIYNQQLVWSVSILITMVVLAVAFKKFSLIELKNIKEFSLATFSGVLYFGASVFMLLAFKNIESAIAFNITQLSFLVVVVAGVFYFKEYNLKAHWKNLLLGTLLAVIGVFVLSFARG